MRAMVLRASAPIESHPLELVEVPRPVPAPGEILVRVSACAVCRTDLHLIEGELTGGPRPIIPGHQIVGQVEQCGPGANRFRVGERVGIAWLRFTCGGCPWCRSGRENLCPRSRYTGWHEHGGYAEFATALEAYAYPLPAGLTDFEAAPLLCAGIIGYRALKRSALPVGGSLGLFGFGSSAHLTMQIARRRGARVLVATRSPAHQAQARRLGATWAGGAEHPLPESVTSAIVFAPAGEIVPLALRSLAPGGTVAVAGIHLSPIPTLNYEECLFHERTLTTVEANTRLDGQELFWEAADGRIRPEISSFPLEEANDVLLLLKSDQLAGTAVLRVGGVESVSGKNTLDRFD